MDGISPQEIRAEIDFLAGTLLAHESLVTSILGELIERKVISQSETLEFVGLLQSRDAHYDDHPDFGVGYKESLQKIESLIQQFR